MFIQSLRWNGFNGWNEKLSEINKLLTVVHFRLSFCCVL